MYLSIGGNELIKKKDIIGIFDLDTSTIGQNTKDFLKKAEKSGMSSFIGDGIPKAFIVMNDGMVYITTISAASLKGRNEKGMAL